MIVTTTPVVTAQKFCHQDILFFNDFLLFTF